MNNSKDYEAEQITNFKCPECESENIKLGYADRCVTWMIQKSNKLDCVNHADMFEYGDPAEGYCLDCEESWNF